ncbi:TPA: alanine--tRNA ligase, partial [Candidatus Woesearchaeota archaeon]|nr:alanine--tRNA ligase [Candidatus Woesearchaeota archaeon]
MHPKELITKYLQFFEKKGHTIIPSASLIPLNDASVLFNTAGMQPLAPYFLGEKHPEGPQLVNIQKCLRTVDFENIGDNTHNTFFFMLGNWSLGAYFKKDSIAMSFEFLTSKKWLNLPLDKLAFTVYKGDAKIEADEAAARYWESHGVSRKRIAFVGKDNFWSAGETGPCGPSTEIFYWSGKGDAPAEFDAEDETWVEIWNNVFMAYNKDSDGNLSNLPAKNVDTGMGFERTFTTIMGKESAYETALFIPVIEKIEKLSHKKYEESKKEMRIMADHIRAAVFVLGDANYVVPS